MEVWLGLEALADVLLIGLKGIREGTSRVSKLPEAKLLAPPFHFQFLLFVLLRWSNPNSRQNIKEVFIPV